VLFAIAKEVANDQRIEPPRQLLPGLAIEHDPDYLIRQSRQIVAPIPVKITGHEGREGAIDLATDALTGETDPDVALEI